MDILKHLNNVQIGKSKGKMNVDFVLNRLQCTEDDVFKIPCHQQAVYSSHSVPPFQARFCPVSGHHHIYSLASEEGNILILDSDRPAKKSLLREWVAHENAIFDMAWVGSDRILTASGDKTAALWDVKSGSKIITCKGHGCSLKSISLQPSNSDVFVSGARDGNIMLWDLRCNNQDGSTVPLFCIREAHDGSASQGTAKQKKKKILQSATRIINPLNSITSVLFQDDTMLLSSGSSDRTIKGWDLRFMSKCNFDKIPFNPIEVKYPGTCVRSHGYTTLVLNPSNSSFFANCTDGVIYRYSCSNLKPKLIDTYYGHKVNSFFVKMDISGDGKYIVSGSTDTKACIWNVDKPGPPIFKLTGHEAEVTAVAWSPSDITKIVTCSDDDRVLHWHLGTGVNKQSENSSNSILGKTENVVLNEIHCPRQVTSSSPALPVTPRSSNPITPTSLKRLSTAPSLTQWFTPKRILQSGLTTLTPPATPDENCYKSAVTPVKRPVLCELRQKTNLTPESLKSNKERTDLALIPRRALILEDKLKENSGKKNKARMVKNSPKNVTKSPAMGIKRFFSVMNGEKS